MLRSDNYFGRIGEELHFKLKRRIKNERATWIDFQGSRSTATCKYVQDMLQIYDQLKGVLI